MKTSKHTMKKPSYKLTASGEFLIENYNSSKAFANFFPGIAGTFGIPMWVFYVNRAQCLCSFGVKDKDHAILEFLPANKAWQLVSTHGFRTFIKLSSRNKAIFYEPFQNGFANSGFNLSNKLAISSYDLKLEELNSTLGLKVNVEYFTIPNDSYAGLARIVTIQNLSRSYKKLELLDGLPQIIPFGTSNLFLKKLSRTIEAWMNVENLEKGVPFYKLDVDPTDRPEVIHIQEGNFYLGFRYEKEAPKIIKPIVDPSRIFGEITDFSCPINFLNAKKFKYPTKETIKSKTPCGFLFLTLGLRPNEQKSFFSVIGYMRTRDILNNSIDKIVTPGYLSKKSQENKSIILKLQEDISTQSNFRELDLYAKQTYLDNIMRGGYPLTFKSGSKNAIFYLYQRKHGDLERDYNKFQIQPTYFSQGNGNYRDMNQNRRCDIWFNPEIKEDNLVHFFNLLQADGFNPLVIKGVTFLLKDKSILNDLIQDKYLSLVASYLDKPFTPGEIIFYLEEHKIKLKTGLDEFLNTIICNSRKIEEAEHGEGFWIDHWHYNLDMLETYLGVYPEKLKEILFDKRVFTFFDNTETVKVRNEKYVLKDGLIRQFHSLSPDNAKRERIKKRQEQPHVVRTQYGIGEIYQTTLINKLVCLLVNKLASLDPFGVGIEMEADKPNWFDALNGLPALLGSSLCETLELKRLVLLLKNYLIETKVEKIYLSEEIYKFLSGLNILAREWSDNKNNARDFAYWDKSYTLKEEYRHTTRFGFSGKEMEMNTGILISALDNALIKLNSGIDKAKDKKKNVYYSYFINEIVEYGLVREHFVKPAKFIQKRLPLFLEGQVHALRVSDDIKKAKALHNATKKSELYDKELKMYKVTANLKSMPEEIGRCRVFTPGWLEHESIWLHMEYKYILELLKQGLYDDFFVEFRNVLIPFQKPARYGRSILENSSFLVSSAFPDKRLHGNGYVARLSGSTAEFLNIWLLMNMGIKVFFLNDSGELNLSLDPILAGWLFDKKGMYSFNFLSKTKIIYYNPKRQNTFGKNAARIKRIVFSDLNNKQVELNSKIIPHPYAEEIRSRQISLIEVYLG